MFYAALHATREEAAIEFANIEASKLDWRPAIWPDRFLHSDGLYYVNINTYTNYYGHLMYVDYESEDGERRLRVYND